MQTPKKHISKLSSILDDASLSMPALARAQNIQRQVSKVGFDWPSPQGARDKITEEIAEIEAEIQVNNQQAIAEECGDLLFAVVNWVRHLNVDAESALHHATDKFKKRFNYVESKLPGDALQKANIDKMEAVWKQAKELGL